MHLRTCTLALVFAALTAGPAVGQEVQGRITGASSGEPVEGAVVQLLDDEERSVAGTLSGPDGSYRLRSPDAGVYRLRVERIGFASQTSGKIKLSEKASIQKSFAVSEQPVRLVGITARGESRGCAVRDGSATVARVWEEARKALNAVRISESDELVLFDLQSFRREVDARSGRVRHEERQASFGRSRNPFRSVPEQDLRRHGFVRVFPDSTVYYGPDADVLLSDAFLDGHCFAVRESAEDPELVGLEFRPLNGGSVPDIEGVLWLDRGSAELRSVEYHYVGSGIDLPVESASGEIEFERVASGAWIVRHWVIRMPVLQLQRSGWYNARSGPQQRSRIVVTAMIEEGGRVVAIRDPDASPRTRGSFAVRGVVMDSLTDRPLEGAVVRLTGTDHRTSSDDRGRFVIDSVAAGSYVITFTHPRLTSLGITPIPRSIEAGRDSDLRIDLAIPSAATLLANHCPSINAESAGMISGYVRRRSDGTGVQGAKVVARWVAEAELRGESLARSIGRSGLEVSPEGAQFDVRIREVEVTTGEGGFYRVCGAPRVGRAEIEASFGGDGRGQGVEVELAPVVARDITLGG